MMWRFWVKMMYKNEYISCMSLAQNIIDLENILIFVFCCCCCYKYVWYVYIFNSKRLNALHKNHGIIFCKVKSDQEWVVLFEKTNKRIINYISRKIYTVYNFDRFTKLIDAAAALSVFLLWYRWRHMIAQLRFLLL